MNPIEKIEKDKIFAVIRDQNIENTEKIVKAVIDAGINIVEIVIEKPEIVSLIKKLKEENPNQLIMAGGIITQRQAQIAIESGADVIVSPVSQMNLVRLCQTRKTPLIMTATTPNEAYSAWKARTQLIKISPANPMGGADYIEDMLRPMKFINIIATGSIKIEDISAYLKAGAKAVGLGRALYKDATYEEIKIRAKQAIKMVQNI